MNIISLFVRYCYQKIQRDTLVSWKRSMVLVGAIMVMMVVPRALVLMAQGQTERPQGYRYSYGRIYFTTTFGVAEAAEMGVEVDHARLREDYIETTFRADMVEEFQRRGIRCEVLYADMSEYMVTRAKVRSAKPLPQYAQAPTNFRLGTMGGFLRLAEIYEDFNRMLMRYPDVVQFIDTIGRSVEGRPLVAYRFGSNASAGKPEVLYTALHHAREPGGAAVMLYFLWDILEKFQAGNPTAQYLLNERQLYVIPCVNPDGYEWNTQTNPSGGGLWRKNRSRNTDNSRGVDLNRNYGTDTFWNASNGGSSTTPTSDTYRGIVPFSEPETRAVRDFILQRNIRVAINYHTFSNLLIYPYSYLPTETPDSTYYRAFTAEITKRNLYSGGRDLQTVGYSVRGASDDYMYAGVPAKKIYALTPEVGTVDDFFWPTPDRIVPQCAENLITNYTAAWSAGANVRPVNMYVIERQDSRFARLVVETQNIGIAPAQPSILRVASLLPTLQSSVTLSPPIRTLRPLASSVGLSFAEAERVSMQRDTFDIAVRGSLTNGSMIPVEIVIVQENVERRDTMMMQVFQPVRDTLFMGRIASTASGWNRGSWGIITDLITGEQCFTDSPNRNYSNSTRNFLQYSTPIRLVGVQSATLEFSTRWSIESNNDFAVVQASSDNGATWRSLRSSVMKPASGQINSAQLDGFGFDGNFPQWIRQECSLNGLVGQNILVRFGMLSDGSTNFDGWYLNDVVVRSYSQTPVSVVPQAGQVQTVQCFPSLIEHSTLGMHVRVILPSAMRTERIDAYVVDMLGRRLPARVQFRASAVHDVTVELPDMSSGTYRLVLTNGEQTSAGMLIVAR